ncbi:MAG TPA: hypothetical protein VFZ72_17750 [Jiangellaceae bacterium]
MWRRLTVTAMVATAAFAASSLPAAADHVHFRVLGGGECVLLAPDGGEKYVQLPYAGEFPENRQHPLHVNVHLGEPGAGGDIYVAYGADGVLTAEAEALCGGVFVND